QLAGRAGDAARHVAPQREFADWIIETVPVGDGLTKAAVIAGAKPKLAVRHIVWNDAQVAALAAALAATAGCGSRLEHQGVDRLVLVVTGEPTAAQIARVA